MNLKDKVCARLNFLWLRVKSCHDNPRNRTVAAFSSSAVTAARVGWFAVAYAAFLRFLRLGRIVFTFLSVINNLDFLSIVLLFLRLCGSSHKERALAVISSAAVIIICKMNRITGCRRVIPLRKLKGHFLRFTRANRVKLSDIFLLAGLKWPFVRIVFLQVRPYLKVFNL